jgi:hypothetical protein
MAAEAEAEKKYQNDKNKAYIGRKTRGIVIYFVV